VYAAKSGTPNVASIEGVQDGVSSNVTGVRNNTPSVAFATTAAPDVNLNGVEALAPPMTPRTKVCGSMNAMLLM
jgi:hypothetical protein